MSLMMIIFKFQILIDNSYSEKNMSDQIKVKQHVKLDVE